jgi:hypothetical protein
MGYSEKKMLQVIQPGGGKASSRRGSPATGAATDNRTISTRRQVGT